MKKDKNYKMFLGKAGEFKVLSELLRNGYNANHLTVDSGIDLLAEKNEELYRFQVKTSQYHHPKINFLLIKLRKEKIKELWDTNTNLIIVSFVPKFSFSIVMPPRLLYMLSSGGFKDKNSIIDIDKHTINLKIIYENRDNKIKLYLKNKKTDCSFLLENYDILDAIDADVSFMPEYAQWSKDGFIDIG